MTITTVNGIVAGYKAPEQFLKTTTTMEAAGVWSSLFYLAGIPGAATAPSPGVNGAVLTTYAGQIPFSNPVSGNTHLAALDVHSSAIGTLLVCDRLWHNSGLSVVSTSGQSVVSPTWPARDINGATAGDGVYLGVEITTATTGVVSNTITVNYLDQDGNAGVGNVTPPTSALAVNSFFPISLAAGDTGVRGLNSASAYTNSVSMTSGAISLVAFRILARISIPNANVGQSKDFAALGLPRLYNNTVPFLIWIPSATAAVVVQGQMTYTQG